MYLLRVAQAILLRKSTFDVSTVTEITTQVESELPEKAPVVRLHPLRACSFHDKSPESHNAQQSGDRRYFLDYRQWRWR